MDSGRLSTRRQQYWPCSGAVRVGKEGGAGFRRDSVRRHGQGIVPGLPSLVVTVMDRLHPRRACMVTPRRTSTPASRVLVDSSLCSTGRMMPPTTGKPGSRRRGRRPRRRSGAAAGGAGRGAARLRRHRRRTGWADAGRTLLPVVGGQLDARSGSSPAGPSGQTAGQRPQAPHQVLVRHDQMAAFQELLAERTTALGAALLGWAGVGKTTLLRHITARFAPASASPPHGWTSTHRPGLPAAAARSATAGTARRTGPYAERDVSIDEYEQTAHVLHELDRWWRPAGPTPRTRGRRGAARGLPAWSATAAPATSRRARRPADAPGDRRVLRLPPAAGPARRTRPRHLRGAGEVRPRTRPGCRS